MHGDRFGRALLHEGRVRTSFMHKAQVACSSIADWCVGVCKYIPNHLFESLADKQRYDILTTEKLRKHLEYTLEHPPLLAPYQEPVSVLLSILLF